jgi:hypothetical protein
VRTPAYENVLFTILRWHPLGTTRNPAPRYIQAATRALAQSDKGKFDLHDEVCFPTEMEAEEHAVELGKHWVNNRIQSTQRLP